MPTTLNERKKLVLSASSFALTVFCVLPALSAPKKSTVSDMDKNFLIAANESNVSEIAYAPVVMKRASSTSAKEFARHMVQDHTKANKQVATLARQLGVKLPQAVPDEEQAVIERLNQEHGAKFDAAYKAEMIRDHLEDISDAEREVSLGSDPRVRALASQLLVTLRGHLSMAKSMSAGVRQVDASATTTMSHDASMK